MAKAVLAIVFNHRFEKNLDLLRSLYSSRFSTLRFLMPFSQRTTSDVIPVYESSYQFQGFVAQAAAALLEADADHFVFAGDDLILNPALNEANIADSLGLDGETSYISEIFPLTRAPIEWGRLLEVLSNFRGAERHTAWKAELPPIEEAVRKFEALGLATDGLEWRGGPEGESIMPMSGGTQRVLKRRALMSIQKLRPLVYPLAWGYSDLVIVPRAVLPDFARYCGVLAAAGVFVESGLPTALALASPKIRTEKDTDWKSTVVWSPPDIGRVLERFDNSLSKLSQGFQDRELSIHPVKLSTFENDLS